MTNRKIAAMHERFGTAPGKCGDCSHFCSGKYHTRNLQKCEVYGLTHSEATDWAQKWTACGLYNKPYAGKQIIDTIKREPRPRPTEQIEGQLSLEELL